MSDENRVVYAFPKGRTSEVRASLSTYRGELRADLRLWVRDESGEMIPTKSGISIPIDDVERLLEAVQALREAAA